MNLSFLSILPMIGIGFKVVMFLSGLMAMVEEAGKDGVYTGPEKKALVMAGLKGMIDTMTSVSKGGQLETWQTIQGKIGPVIDVLADLLFPDHKAG